MGKILGQADIAKFFGNGNGGIMQKLTFQDKNGMQVQVRPTLSWYIATSYYENIISPEQFMPKVPEIPIYGYVYIAVVHTEMGSRALLYFDGIDQYLPTSDAPYPYVVDIDPNLDSVHPNLKAFDLTAQIKFIGYDETTSNILGVYTDGISSRTVFNFNKQKPDESLSKFKINLLTTVESITQQYKNDKLSERFKVPQSEK